MLVLSRWDQPGLWTSLLLRPADRAKVSFFWTILLAARCRVRCLALLSFSLLLFWIDDLLLFCFLLWLGWVGVGAFGFWGWAVLGVTCWGGLYAIIC
jgi:hypothetical protein